MYRISLVFAIILALFSCKKEPVFKTINFETSYLFNKEIETKFSEDSSANNLQMIGTDYALKGDYKNAVRIFDKAFGIREINFSESKKDSLTALLKPYSAKDYIIEQSKKHQFVIINEAHHVSKHRIFTESLLQNLYDQGYRYFGLEALNSADSLLNSRKYTINTTGYYTKDPSFSNLLNTAMEIGYELFSYEGEFSNSSKERELLQVENILAQFKKDTKGKYLIHCGYAHANEGETRLFQNRAMAQLIKDTLNTNPFTISQTKYGEHSNPKNNHPTTKVYNVKETSVLVDSLQVAKLNVFGKSYTDISVIHPQTSYINGRPDWLFSNGRKKVEFTITDKQLVYPIMVFAFKNNVDSSQVIPSDLMELSDNKQNITFALKVGDYQIIILDSKQNAKSTLLKVN